LRLKRLRVRCLSQQGFLKTLKVFEEDCLAIEDRPCSPYIIVTAGPRAALVVGLVRRVARGDAPEKEGS